MSPERKYVNRQAATFRRLPAISVSCTAQCASNMACQQRQLQQRRLEWNGIIHDLKGMLNWLSDASMSLEREDEMTEWRRQCYWRHEQSIDSHG